MPEVERSGERLPDENQDEPRADGPSPTHNPPVPPSAAPERASSISVVDRGSVAGIRGALYFQAAVALAFAPIAYQVLLGLSALSGSDAADIHGLASGFIAFVVIPTALHLWAAIQVGRSSWGGALLVVSVLATVVQILMLLPYFVLPAVPFIVALIIELVSLANQDTRRRIESGSAPKFAGLPELIVLPLAIAVFAGLMAWNGNVNDATPAMPETPNPTREFDASEGRQRLEEVVDETLPAFQEVDGFEGLGEERRMENASGCEDGAAPGEEWVDLSIEYDLGEFEPDSELSLAYLESIRTRWTEQGYEVTLYVRENDSGVMQNRRLTAVRDDGVAAVYDVGYGSASFVVRTGCVLQPE